MRDNQERNDHLAEIHILARKYGMKGSSYRKYLEDMTGLDSCKLMTRSQRLHVISDMRTVEDYAH